MKKSLCVLAVAALLTAASCTSSREDPAPVDAPLTVSTTSGVLHGKAGPNTRQFLGIRYAAAPTGDKRWTLPQAVDASDTDVDASSTGPSCPQSNAVLPSGSTKKPSEDCLFLNVTTPRRQSPNATLPVVVFWHGGGYTTGSGGAYDAQRLADRGNVIVVTPNYRLGIFGYLGLPGLNGSGDFGFADQIESLRWVQRNITAFGGDKDNVTLSGQSAGGAATCAALTSPTTEGLFDKAIIMSGSCELRWPTGTYAPKDPVQSVFASLADNEKVSTAASSALGCTGPETLTCMRRLSADTVLGQNDNFSNKLAYDTPLLPRDPAAVVRESKQRPMPVISGGVHNEARAGTAGLEAAVPGTFTAATYPDLIRQGFGDRANDVLARYPLSRFGGSAQLAWSTAVTDASWSCRTIAGAQSMSANARVYSYEFADDTAPNTSGAPNTPAMSLGATHATDLPYLFDLLGTKLVTSPEQEKLADTMIDYWASFARDGVPSARVAIARPATSPKSAPVLSFADGSARLTDYSADHECSFWQGIALR